MRIRWLEQCFYHFVYLINNAWILIVIPKIKKFLRTLSMPEARMQILLMLAMFFNPVGFDVLFATIMRYTNSYWLTDIIFYGLSMFFFGLFFYQRHIYIKTINGQKEKI